MAQPAPVPRALILVVHGAEIFDSGEVAWLIRLLRPTRTIVAGVMARTAAEESGLPVEFDGAPPSRIIRSLSGEVILGNHAKTPESGEIFGSVIASRLGRRGLVQVECTKKAVIVWDGGDRNLGLSVAGRVGFSLEILESQPANREEERSIRGCLPGESVYVDGTIIGTATDSTVILRKRGSRIEAVRGLAPKEHGLEKLDTTCPDLATAWCKSGPIRLHPPSGGGGSAVRSGRIAVVDHCGHMLYGQLTPDCCGVLAIGDDTTAVCGHICMHRGIPVLGIVDGDRDTFLPSAFAPGSVVLEAVGERDDDLGREVAGMVGKGPVLWADWTAGVTRRLGSRVRVVIDTRALP